MIAINPLRDDLAKEIVDELNKKGWEVYETSSSNMNPVKEIELYKTYSIFPRNLDESERGLASTYLFGKNIFEQVERWIDFETKSKVNFKHHENNKSHSYDFFKEKIEKDFPDINKVMKHFPAYLNAVNAFVKGDESQIY